MERVLVKILSFDVDSFSFEEAVEYASSHFGQIVTINPEMISTAQKQPEFANIIHNADMVVADGIGVELGLKILGHNVKRIPGIELGRALINKFADDNRSIALIGAKPEVICKTVENIKREIPKANIVYYHDGYFTDNEVVYKDLVNCNPDLILVALGSPKQEVFINELKQRLPKSLMIGLGGSFDVWAGVVKRAPVIYQKLGMEWIYRILNEPARFKRVFPTLPLFIIDVFKERLLKNKC